MEQEFNEFSKFREYDKSMKHELNYFKELASNICLPGTVAAYWSHIQKAAGSSHFIVMTNIFATEFF